MWSCVDTAMVCLSQWSNTPEEFGPVFVNLNVELYKGKEVK